MADHQSGWVVNWCSICPLFNRTWKRWPKSFEFTAVRFGQSVRMSLIGHGSLPWEAEKPATRRFWPPILGTVVTHAPSFTKPSHSMVIAAIFGITEGLWSIYIRWCQGGVVHVFHQVDSRDTAKETGMCLHGMEQVSHSHVNSSMASSSQFLVQTESPGRNFSCLLRYSYISPNVICSVQFWVAAWGEICATFTKEEDLGPTSPPVRPNASR